MEKLTAYAKINLFLEITGRRPDSYHNIDTVMNRISLCDYIDIEATDGEYQITCNRGDIPCDEKNLVYKASRLFNERSGIAGGISCYIEKNIPSGAGLGGGSSDAASVLLYLNGYYGNILSYEDLCSVAKNVGADVPYFLKDGCARATEIGDKLTYIQSLSGIPTLIIPGGEKVSTARAYNDIDRMKSMPVSDVLWNRLESGGKSLDEFARLCFNRFEDISDYCHDVISSLLCSGAATAHLSGSGSSVYALFDSVKSRDEAYEKIGGICCETV